MVTKTLILNFRYCRQEGWQMFESVNKKTDERKCWTYASKHQFNYWGIQKYNRVVIVFNQVLEKSHDISVPRYLRYQKTFVTYLVRPG